MDPANLKPEHGVIAAIASALGTIAGRFLPRKQLPAGPTKRERELEEKLLEQRFASMRADFTYALEGLRRELADVLRENGRQGLRIEALEKDLDNYFRKLRGEKPE